MFRKVSATIAALFLLPCLGMAQEGRSQLSVGFTGDFSRQSSGNGIVLDPTDSGGFLATYNFFYWQRQAIELNYGHTSNSQNYTFGGLSSPLNASIHEFTAAYVFAPFRARKFSPYLMAGGGALAFDPKNAANTVTPGAGSQTRGAFLYGAGVDYKLLRHVALRLQYRGLGYKAPNFGVSALSTGGWGHIAEPGVGIVFNF